jgi:hypothetical protein
MLAADLRCQASNPTFGARKIFIVSRYRAIPWTKFLTASAAKLAVFGRNNCPSSIVASSEIV